MRTTGLGRRARVAAAALATALLATACGVGGDDSDDADAEASADAESEQESAEDPADDSEGESAAPADEDEAAACETPDEWVIGWINPLSGNAATFGELSRNAAELALEDINADGGIDGVPVSVRYEDNQLSPETSVTAAQSLADDGVRLIITAGSSVVFAVDPIAQQRDLLVANHAAQSPQLLTGTERTYNFIPTSAAETERLAELAIERLDLQQVALLRVDSDYGQDTADAFVESFEAQGGEIVATEVHEEGATDMRTQLIKIRDADPDAVLFVSNITEIGHGVAQTREVGIDAELLGVTFALSPDNYEIAGEAMNGMNGVAVTFQPDASDVASEFAERYEDEYGTAPTIYSASTFDAVKILAQAIEETGCDTPEEVSAYLDGLEDYQGVLGETTMDDQRTVQIPLFEYVIEDLEPVPWTE